MCDGMSRNHSRSHSSSACRKSSDVLSSSLARRVGSAEYIGMRQPVVLATVSPAITAKRILRIEAILRDFARAPLRPCGLEAGACLPPRMHIGAYRCGLCLNGLICSLISDCPLGSEDKICAAL